MTFSTSNNFLLLCFAIILVIQVAPVAAFGAGNIASISAIEGQNWRHGDIEDTLLNILMARVGNGGRKFSKLDVKRVYFGNWLRDYSQAVDVGTVKYVSAQAIRLLIWVLGFSTFGYGSGEFEVTMDRLGCYRPEEHIDNPKDYADNLDARQYDPRLRGPVDEHRELNIDPQTGLKNYIASEHIGITTSAGLVRRVFGQSIQLGRQYARSKNKADLYEALRLLGQGCHCLEDYTAHSNYCETALIELGERNVFPHVGRQTQINLPGVAHPVWPIVTGTFGGVDFAYSVMGEFGDRVTQSEIQELQGTIESSQNSGQNFSLLQDLLKQVPSGLLGGTDQAGKVEELQMNAQAAQLQNIHVTPRQPEAWTKQLEEVSKEIYPILEWHDEIMKSITEFIEQLPILPQLIEQLTAQVNILVFTLLAPLILPIINQVKTELAMGSNDIIKSSQAKQLIVFHDDKSTNPTHSMLSKDHFSNILNEPAGKVASQILKWVVPQIMACWDDERIDVNRTLTRIVNGVFHHPALRDRGDDGAMEGRKGMFQIMQQWWGQKIERERTTMRDQLSRDGVEKGRNQKAGVHDTGHGCGKPVGLANTTVAASSGASSALPIGNILGQINAALAGQSQYDPGAVKPGGKAPISDFSQISSQVLGGASVGGIVSGLVGGIGGDLLGEAFSSPNAQKQNYQSYQHRPDASYTQNYTQTGHSLPQAGQPQSYGQAEISQTSYPGGRERQEFQRYEQSGPSGQGGYGEQVILESQPTYSGGYEQTIETRYKRPGSGWQSGTSYQDQTSGEEFFEANRHGNYEGYKEDLGFEDEHKRSRHHKEHHEHGVEHFGNEYQNHSSDQGSSFVAPEFIEGNTILAESYQNRRRDQPETRYAEELRLEEQRLYEERRRRNADLYDRERIPNSLDAEIFTEQRPPASSEPFYAEGRFQTEGRYGVECERERLGREDAYEREEIYEPEPSGRFEEDVPSREEVFDEDDALGEDRGYGQVEEYEERRGYGEDY